ncbi:receptor-type tyrosine-protein phosphatase F-like [Scomber japonicus]|uniref:receptor-type tyrosine-protein phosphatase F-like n=1 Tax=Scomber japonicus TaxID=13676 RepID=UPI0023057681|nr:receptor-type tyrosine-protein phosphatase F-like [Scomber japonicus]
MVPNTHLLFLVLLNSMVISSLAESLPSFVKSPEDQTGVSGGVASFVCQATGEPKPRITWMKNGKTISNRRTEMIEFDDGSGSVLRIELLRTDRDGAIYKCTATNSAGEINTSAKLTVHEENQIPHGFPIIDMGPQLKVVERTRTATMLCAASGNPDPEISWFKDMLPVDISSSNGRIKQLRSGALLIENSEESDQGKYECVAMNSAGTRYSAPANLYVRARRVPPRFSIPPTNQEVILGGSVNLTCVAVGSPMPYVKWMNGGVDLTKEEEMPIGRNVLEVTNIQESANYTCVAISPLGMIEATAQVTVKGLPSFVKSPEDQTGFSGGVASFVCQAAGEPKPRITWMKNGEKVSSQHFEVIEFDDGSGSVLRIEPLRTDRDGAIYECTATNSAGEISTSAKLTVLEENQIPHGFPVIDMGPQLKVVERTRTATMLCAASGNPDPEISWFKDMLPVDISSSNGRIKQLRSGALQIENSEESDQGKYECVAMNSAGTCYSAPANLYVRVQRVPPRFSIPPTNQEVILGGSVSLTCVAVGSPMPHVKWMNGGVDLTKEDEMPVGRNVLEVTNIQESANYTCVAISSLGMIEATAQVTVKGESL